MAKSNKVPQVKFDMRKVDDLIPYARNARTHSPEQIAKLAGSIREFGFINPVIISSDGGILAGHGRVMAAQKLKMDEVPCIEESHLTDAQRRAYILADNRLALDAGWDDELLKVEIKELSDLDFDLSLTGFDEEELNRYINGVMEESISESTDDNTTPYDGTSFGVPIQYEPTGRDVSLDECCDIEKYSQMVKEIEGSDIPDDVKSFLLKAATRHIVFDYRNIAEYYASKATPEMQRLMEKSALVLIDYDDAIKNGFVTLTKRLDDIRMSEIDNEEDEYEG